MSVTVVDLDQWLDKLMKKKKISKYEIDITGNASKGDGYLGEITFVKVIACIDNNQEEKRFDFVVKSAKADEAFRNKSKVDLAYKREIFMYQKVFPIFVEFQKERNLKELFLQYPKCHFVADGDSNETLILNNLKYKGFVMHNRKVTQDLNHALLAVRNYAKFHGMSYVLRKEKPGVFNSLTKNFSDVFATMFAASGLKTAFISYFRQAKEIIKTRCSEEVAAKINNEFNDDHIVYVCSEMASTVKNPVIIHGDCWNNNILFKYEDNSNTKPTDLAFVDFQLCRLASPAFDISYYLYTCLDNYILKEFSLLLKEYYNSFSTFLKQFGLNPQEIMSYDDLLSQWKMHARYGLVMAPFLLKLELSESDEVLDLTKDDGNEGLFECKKMRNQEEYDRRLIDVFNHYVKTCTE